MIPNQTYITAFHYSFNGNKPTINGNMPFFNEIYSKT